MYPLLQLSQALAKFFRGFQPWRGQDLANAAERKVITMTEIGADDLGDAFFQLTNEHLETLHILQGLD